MLQIRTVSLRSFSIYSKRWTVARVLHCIQSCWSTILWYLFPDTAVIFYRKTSSAQVRRSSAIFWRYNKQSPFLVHGNFCFCRLAGNVMTLKFLSDASVTAGGFQLKYQAIDASQVPRNYTGYFNWVQGVGRGHTELLFMCVEFFSAYFIRKVKKMSMIAHLW